MNWQTRVDKMVARVKAEGKIFINPRTNALNYQAALEAVGKGIINFDGANFTKKEEPQCNAT